MILVDTNVLLRSVQVGHHMHARAVAVISELRFQNQTLCIVPQNLYEFWVVATRPLAANGLGISASEADADLDGIVGQFRLIRDERAILEPWRRLVSQLNVIGKNAHDARLVAAMQRHGINQILTFNVDDFKRFPGITTIDAAVGS